MNKNILLDKLPIYTPNGLKIRTDFREGIKFELLMQDNKISDKEKIAISLNLFFYDTKVIKNIKIAINDIIWFYTCGKIKDNKEIVDNNKNKNNNKQKQIYNYEFDAEYIYSAFMEQYKINLNKIPYLHWWEFRALLNSLNENVLFSKIMSYRAIDLSKIKDKETKKYYKKMKQIYKFPDMRSEEEKEEVFANELW